MRSSRTFISFAVLERKPPDWLIGLLSISLSALCLQATATVGGVVLTLC